MRHTCDIPSTLLKVAHPLFQEGMGFQPRTGSAEPTKPELMGHKKGTAYLMGIVRGGCHASSQPPLLDSRTNLSPSGAHREASGPKCREGEDGRRRQAAHCLLQVSALLGAVCLWMGPLAPGLLPRFSTSA